MFFHHVLSDIKEIATFIVKLAFIVAVMILPFYLIHLIEINF